MSTPLRAGYKQTEVGVIPEDWDAKRLGELAAITAGGTPSRANPLYWNGDIPWITTTEVDSHTIDNAEQFITKEGLNNSAAKMLPPGTLLMALYGQGKTRGKVGVLGIEAATNQACAAISLHRGVFGNFVLHFLRSQYEAIRNLSNTGSQENLNNSLVRSIQIRLPPEAEQEAIAEALNDADALIESLEQLVTKKLHLKQGAMRELLTGKKRLPGFNGEWKVKQLDAVAEIRSGGTPSTNQPEFWDGDILWCTPTDITGLRGCKYLTQTSRTISSQGLKCSSAELIPADSVVMTSRATIGECAINVVPVATNQGFKNFIPFPNTDGEFLYYLLQTKKQEFISLCGGSTFLEISKTQLASFEIQLPKEKPEQIAIAAVLSDMDAEISDLDAQLTKIRTLKQGMMHKLLTGKIRLL